MAALLGSSEIQNCLEKWDDLDHSLAPLSKKQCEVLDQLFSGSQIDSGECAIVSGNEDLVKPFLNAKEFLEFLSSGKDKNLGTEDVQYVEYVKALRRYRDNCNSLLNEIDSGLEQLNVLRSQYDFVSNRTNALHQSCEALLDEQSKLVNAVETINERLCYFTEAETLSEKLSSPLLSVLSDGFVPILVRIDECISYLEANRHFKEAGVYLVRYGHLQSQALGMIRSYVTSSLENTTRQILERRDSTWSITGGGDEMALAPDAFTLLYARFRVHAPRIRTLMTQIEDRVAMNPSYQDLLDECYGCYVNQRETLLASSVQSAISDLAAQHARDHCALVRSGCAFMTHLCDDERQLHGHFFSRQTPHLDMFLSRLCGRLYDVFRPIIIHINHLETLSELCSILKVETVEQRTPGIAFAKMAQQMLEDVQERLVYRTLVYIRTDILGYNPAPGDLAYPEKLEMMESIAESVAQQQQQQAAKSDDRSMSRCSSGASLTSFAIDQGSSSLAIDDASSLASSRRSVIKASHHSPADLHGMWYPTVRRTLVCLSKLYRCLDRTIFQGLSQEVLAMCIESLIIAGQAITKNKTPTDGALFQIKHLLILREQIAPFQIDFAIRETSLDFTRIREAAMSLMTKKSRLFSLGTNNALLEFVFEGTPQVKESLIDSKKAVDNHLKTVCEEFISATAKRLIGTQLETFLEQAEVILRIQRDEPARQVKLRSQPWASPEVLNNTVAAAYRHLKTTLPLVLRALSLYLANRDTEQILFRPIRSRVVASYDQLNQIIRTNYTEDEQRIIACPAVEQINILLSTTSLR